MSEKSISGHLSNLVCNYLYVSWFVCNPKETLNETLKKLKETLNDTKEIQSETLKEP